MAWATQDLGKPSQNSSSVHKDKIQNRTRTNNPIVLLSKVPIYSLSWKGSTLQLYFNNFFAIWHITHYTAIFYFSSKDSFATFRKPFIMFLFIWLNLVSGRNDAKAETLGLWAPHAKRWLTGKDSDAGRDWGQEEKGMTEDGMAGWHHRLDGHESEWTPGVGDGQGGLACCDSWGRKESDTTADTTEQLNWTELNWWT